MAEGHTPLTVEFKINLMRPATGARLDCRARVLRSGRLLTVAESTVHDAQGRLVAKALVTIANVELSALKR